MASMQTFALELFSCRAAIWRADILILELWRQHGLIRHRKEHTMLLDLGKALSFLLSLLSLYPLLFTAFFVPGTHWQDRLLLSIDKAALAAFCCFVSGILFSLSEHHSPTLSAREVLATLPVRLYFLALGGMALLFVASWYLETYYVPLLWKNLPH
jgi:hypothetical protein